MTFVNLSCWKTTHLRKSDCNVVSGTSCSTLRTVLPAHVRTIFSSTGIGMDNFKLAREQHVSRHATSIGNKSFTRSCGRLRVTLGSCRRIQTTLSRIGQQLGYTNFHRRLEKYDHGGRYGRGDRCGDPSFEKVVELPSPLSPLLLSFGLYRYNTNKLRFTNFHFGSPIMRLLYLHNKSDLAMQLYMDEVSDVRRRRE